MMNGEAHEPDVEEYNGGLNEREAKIMALLIEAWNLWCAYRFDGSSNRTRRRFQAGIHQCQEALGQVVLNRLFPDFWRFWE